MTTAIPVYGKIPGAFPHVFQVACMKKNMIDLLCGTRMETVISGCLNTRLTVIRFHRNNERHISERGATVHIHRQQKYTCFVGR